MSDAAPVQAATVPHPADLVRIAAEVVSAYAAKNSVPLADLSSLLASVHRTLVDLGRPGSETSNEAKPTPPVSVKKSIGDDYLVSMEDGKRYMSLKRHLAKHGLTPAEYRTKWGLPSDYPMVTAAYARKRSDLAKAMHLGTQRRKGSAAPATA